MSSNELGCVFISIRGWFRSLRFWLFEASPLLCRLAAATACAWAFFALGRCLRAVQWGKKSDARPRPRQSVLPVKSNPVVDPIPEPDPKSRTPEGGGGERAEEEEDQEATRRLSYDNAIQQGSELEPNEKAILEEQSEAEHDNPEQSEQPPCDPDATPFLPSSTVPPISTLPTVSTATAGSAVRRRQFRVKQQSYMEAISHGMIAAPAPEPSIPEEDTPTKPQATPTQADHPSGSEEPKPGQAEALVSRRDHAFPKKQESYMEAIKQGVGRQDHVEDDIPPPKLPPLDPVKETGRLETEI